MLTKLRPNRYPGKLIVVEGVDGSGKSTQIALLHDWLKSRGLPVKFTEWNSSPAVKPITRRAKKKQMLTPGTFSLLHAADLAARLESEIIPWLKAGGIVCADRYVYTAFARDAARGVDPAWLRELYSFAIQPTVAFYFKLPQRVALQRVLTGRQTLNHYEAGMDLKLTSNIEQSFRLFQARVIDEYERMLQAQAFTVMDATQRIEAQQAALREQVLAHLAPMTLEKGTPLHAATA